MNQQIIKTKTREESCLSTLDKMASGESSSKDSNPVSREPSIIVIMLIALLAISAPVSAIPSVIITSPGSITLDRTPSLVISSSGADNIWYSLDGMQNTTLGASKAPQNISMIANSGFETVTESDSSVPAHWQFYDSTAPIEWNSGSYSLTPDTPFGSNALQFSYDSDDTNDYLLQSAFVATGKKKFDVEFYAKPGMSPYMQSQVVGSNIALDRNIISAGGTVSIYGFGWNSSGNITLEITSPGGIALYSESKTTDEYGNASFIWTAPADAQSGEYTARIYYTANQSISDSAPFRLAALDLSYGYCVEFRATESDYGNTVDDFFLCFNNTGAWSLDEWATAPLISYSMESVGNGWFKINFTTPEISPGATHINIGLMPAYDDGTYTGSVIIDEIAVLLDYGTHTLDIWADDTISTSKSTKIFKVSTYIPPEISLTSPANSSIVANSTALRINATSDTPVDSCQISVNGQSNETMENTYENVFVKDIHFSADGALEVRVYCNDTQGDWGDATYAFHADSTAPVVNITSPSNTTYDRNSISLEYSTSEPSTCSYSLNNATRDPLPGNITITAPEKGNTVTVICADTAGNEGNATASFTVNTKSYIYIEDISTGARVFVDGTEYETGSRAETKLGNTSKITVTFNGREYSDEILIGRDIHLNVEALKLSLSDTEKRLISLSSAANDSIYIIDADESSSGTIRIGASSGTGTLKLVGLHIRTGGSVYVGDTWGAGSIKDLVVLGTIDIISGLSPARKNTESAFFGSMNSSSPTGIYANTVKANNLLIKDTTGGTFIEELDITAIDERDSFGIYTDDSDSAITILSANISGAHAHLDNKYSDRLNMKSPFAINPWLAEDGMFWYRSLNGEKYGFEHGWTIDSHGNYVNNSNIDFENIYPSYSDVSLYSKWEDMHNPSYMTLFNIITSGSLYFSGTGWHSSKIALLGPLIESDEIIIYDNTKSATDNTDIYFHTGLSTFGLPAPAGSTYEKDSYGNTYSKNVVIRLEKGLFVASNPLNSIDFNLAGYQDVIILSGTDELKLSDTPSSAESWKIHSDAGSHWVIENITINLTGSTLGTQPDKWFLSEGINIVAHNLSFNSTHITVTSSTDYENDSMYILYREHGATDSYTRIPMKKSASKWQTSFMATPDRYYDTITVGIQNDGLAGKAIEDQVSLETDPPEITQISPAGDFATNMSDVTVTFRATDNMARIIRCSLMVDSIKKSEVSIENNSIASLHATALTPGTHTYNISCRDSSGNAATTIENQLTIDIYAPESVIINTPRLSAKLSGQVSINVSASDALSGIDSVSVIVTDSNNDIITKALEKEGSYYTGTYDSSDLADGTQAITVHAKDRAGNTNRHATTSITADNTGPEISITTDRKSAVIGDTIKFMISVDETDSVKNTTRLNIWFNSSVIKSYNRTDLENISYSVYRVYMDTSGFQKGAYKAVAESEDSMGNKGTRTIEFTVKEKEATTSPAPQPPSTETPAIITPPPEQSAQAAAGKKDSSEKESPAPVPEDSADEKTAINETNTLAREKENVSIITSITGLLLGSISGGINSPMLPIASFIVLVFILTGRDSGRSWKRYHSGMGGNLMRTKRLRSIKRLIRR